MKMKLLFVAAMVLTGVLCTQSNAQEMWGGYSSSCDRQGRCHLDSRDYDYGAGSIELIPYGTAGRQSFRLPPQNGPDYYSDYEPSPSASCEGGFCPRSQYASQYGSRYGGQGAGSGSCLGGRCHHESAAYGNDFDARRSSPNAYSSNQQPEYGANNYSNPNSFVNPSRRPQRWYGAAPADRRPDLNRLPFAPRTNMDPNNFRSESRSSQLVPPTPTQIIPPPKLPPQPSANLNQRDAQDSRFESIPHLLPPTSVGKSQLQQRG